MTPKQQLDGFLAEFEPAIAETARAALKKMRELTPGAIEMVYDNFNWLVIGFVPNERASDAIFSIVVGPKRVTLCFLQGARLADPKKLLHGSGKVVRNLPLGHKKADVTKLDDAQVRGLIDLALERADVPLNPNQKRRLVIKSVSATKRPRSVAAGSGGKNSKVKKR